MVVGLGIPVLGGALPSVGEKSLSPMGLETEKGHKLIPEQGWGEFSPHPHPRFLAWGKSLVPVPSSS